MDMAGVLQIPLLLFSNHGSWYETGKSQGVDECQWVGRDRVSCLVAQRFVERMRSMWWK